MKHEAPAGLGKLEFENLTTFTHSLLTFKLALLSTISYPICAILKWATSQLVS